jgi:hypothetical protein
MFLIEESLQNMIAYLDQAALVSSDPPDSTAIQTTYLQHTGRRGRPRIEIDPEILATSLEMRGPTGLAPVFGISSRTIRRRALELGLVEPCPPVFARYETEDGSIHTIHSSSTAPMSAISDDELDAIIRGILDTFPDFGRRMLNGHLRHLGYRIPRSRLQESYLRVHGPPPLCHRRRIERRVYSVPGPNALWHHDGQHGRRQIRPLFPNYIEHPCYRTYTLEACNSCIRRWLFPPRHCNPGKW